MMELEEKKMELINTKAELASRSTSAKSSEIHFDEKIGYEEDIKQLKASSIILKRKIEEQKLEIYNLNQNHQTEFEKQKLEGGENKVGCVLPMVVISIRPQTEFGRNDDRKRHPTLLRPFCYHYF